VNPKIINQTSEQDINMDNMNDNMNNVNNTNNPSKNKSNKLERLFSQVNGGNFRF
jgi:hypothetical protein